ncbi:MAG: hypothetical protein ACLQEQ_04510 [Nitrososphaerales archaeon]
MGKYGKRFKDEPTGSRGETGVFGQPRGGRRRIQEIVARFREKGATNPEKAMTAQELGLPPRFEEAMKRRLGATGIFVEVGGRYYLDEARLTQFEQSRGTGAGGPTGGPWASRQKMLGLRMVRMVVGVAVLALILTDILYAANADVRLAVIALIVLWIALTVFQLSYLARARSRLGGGL